MFHFHGLINTSFNKFESFGSQLRSKAASFALESMVHFPFFTTVKMCLSLSKSRGQGIRTEVIALNHHAEV